MWEDSRMHRTVFNCRQKQYSTFKREIVMGRVVRKHIDTRNSNFAAFYQNSQITTEIASSLIASFPTPSQCSRFVHSIIFPHITHTPVIWCDEFGALMVTGQARSTFIYIYLRLSTNFCISQKCVFLVKIVHFHFKFIIILLLFLAQFYVHKCKK